MARLNFEVRPHAAAEAVLREVGTADDARAAREVHLAVQEVGLPDGADSDRIALHPICALAGEGLLGERLVRNEAALP